MKVAMYVSIATLALAMAGCGAGKQKTAATTAGIDIANLDTTVLPGTDFYEYACGGWMKANPLTDEYSRFGSFDKLRASNQEQLRTLIEEQAAGQHTAGSLAQKIGDLYNLAMDSVKLNADGAAPIKELLAGIDDVKEPSQLLVAKAQLSKQRTSPYFGLYVGADDKNSSINIVHLSQGGLGMGQREYYLQDDERSKNIRQAYQTLISNLFVLSGYDQATAKRAVASVMNIETRLAKAARTRVELRDPQTNYNKKTVKEWAKEIPGFDWTAYLNAAGLPAVDEIDLGQPEAIKAVADLIKSVPMEQHRDYLRWNIIRSSANYLSDDFAAQSFEFFDKTLSGKKEMQPRWKRAVSTVESALGEAVGELYVEKYFPAAAKERMTTLVKNLQTALGERIQNLSWMGDTTKVKALEKLSTFHVKIGYPDKWKDYTSLSIEKDSYLANVMRAGTFRYNEMVEKAGKPVDADEWHMTPQTVNAYYNPTTNEICFPAGILQYPFFDMQADDAFNYGAIGVVIGHEMTHGFDDSGRQYDKDGNLKDWWTAEDAKNFDERAQVMVNFYDSIQVAPGVHANGRYTLGENIADYGGLQVAFQAFRNATAAAPLPVKEGFTPEQRFFLAYAGVWAGNVRPEEILRLTDMDEHSLGRWRVNGEMPQIDAWYEAFHITDKDPMYVAPEKRVSIW